MRLPAQRRAARRSAHWDVQPPSLAALCLHSPMLHSPAVDLRATRCVQRSTLAARLAARHPRQACGRTSDSLHACVPHQLQAELSEAVPLSLSLNSSPARRSSFAARRDAASAAGRAAGRRRPAGRRTGSPGASGPRPRRARPWRGWRHQLINVSSRADFGAHRNAAMVLSVTLF